MPQESFISNTLRLATSETYLDLCVSYPPFVVHVIYLRYRLLLFLKPYTGNTVVVRETKTIFFEVAQRGFT